jgi:hypothetical protein
MLRLRSEIASRYHCSAQHDSPEGFAFRSHFNSYNGGFAGSNLLGGVGVF